MNNRQRGAMAGGSGQSVSGVGSDYLTKRYFCDPTKVAQGCSGSQSPNGDEAKVIQAPKPPSLGASEINSSKDLWKSVHSKSPRIGGFRGLPRGLLCYKIIRQQSLTEGGSRRGKQNLEVQHEKCVLYSSLPIEARNSSLKGSLLTLVLSILSLGVMANTALALPWVERLEGGSAAIQNSGDTSYRPASVGAQIGLDEAVLPSPRARMVVRCPNNTRRRVVPGRISGIGLICPNLSIARRSRGENEVLALNNGTFPYVLQVLDERPTLAWPGLSEEFSDGEGLQTVQRAAQMPSAGFDEMSQPSLQTYRVSVYRVEQTQLEPIWQIETLENSIEYDGPPLEPGETYSLIADTTDAETLCGEGNTGLQRWRLGECFRMNFQRLDTDVTLGEASLNAGALDAETRVLALAYAYRGAGAYGQVLKLIAPLVGAGDQPAAVYELWADSYWRLGWVDEAKAAFERAERVATRDGDFQTRLAAKLGLVEIAAWQMQSETAVDYLWEALRDASYEQDQDQANVILQLIRKLS